MPLGNSIKIPLALAVDSEGYYCVSVSEDENDIISEAAEHDVTNAPVAIYRIEIEVDLPTEHRGAAKIEKDPSGNFIMRFLKGQ